MRIFSDSLIPKHVSPVAAPSETLIRREAASHYGGIVGQTARTNF